MVLIKKKYLIKVLLLICFIIYINNVIISYRVQETVPNYCCKPLMYKDKLGYITLPRYISHGGGEIKGYTITNCKEALDISKKKGYQFIEVDIEWTKDNMPVLIHSWDGILTKFFGVEPQKYNYKEFKELTMIEGFTQMTMEDLVQWMKDNEEIYIITDVKTNNIQLLKLIKENYSDVLERIIPQIYSFEEYPIVKSIGYKHIILTLYKMKNLENRDIEKEIVSFNNSNKLLAVTMPINIAKTGVALKLKEENIIVYCHTINDIKQYKELQQVGVYGIYTDNIIE